jgi:hypothetical protein
LLGALMSFSFSLFPLLQTINNGLHLFTLSAPFPVSGNEAFYPVTDY